MLEIDAIKRIHRIKVLTIEELSQHACLLHHHGEKVPQEVEGIHQF